MTWNSSNWATPCALNADCDDGLFCNGTETCENNFCKAGASPVIDDGVGCTIDTCDETLDTVVHAANDTACSDGLFCNGTEVCDAVLDCQAGTPLVLDDGNACTIDTCDETGSTILHTPIDTDSDGVADCYDICPGFNDNTDGDLDGVPDGCDALPANVTEWKDTDGDGIGDNADNCPSVANPGSPQTDTDHDAIGDACDSTPSTANYGSVIDAPHNETRGIKCGDCHSYSLWWQHSPANASTSPSYAAITNAVCAKCHANVTHFSVTPGAEFSTKCVDCHSAHDQAQVDWRGTVNIDDLYLKRGTITGNFVVTGGKTTFTYTLTESYVPANPEWSDFTTWGKKNNTLPPSGLILVVDTTNATNTYEVLSATGSTITVKGGIDPLKAGKSFGLIYGQMIKKSIATSQGNRDVKFFNPIKPGGGYTDSNIPVTGICQVCHDSTTYWTNDGGNTGHQSGVNCTNCHSMAQGFKP